MCAAPVRRKLAAILAAAAVGYSRLMTADEEWTMKILSAHRTVIDGIIEFHEGRIVGTAARLTRRDLMRRDGRQERVTER